MTRDGTLKRHGLRKYVAPTRKPRDEDEFRSFVIESRAAVLRRADGPDRLYIAVPKDEPARSEEYRRLVAAMPCIHCGRVGASQAAHGDMNKGGHIKSDDRTCYPACADAPLRQGCHSLIGATGSFTREQRRAIEARYARQTRAAIMAAGTWPKSLPMWEEQDV